MEGERPQVRENLPEFNVTENEMSKKIFVAPEIAGESNVVEINGKCFERLGPAENEPDVFHLEQTFESCEDCGCCDCCYRGCEMVDCDEPGS